MNSRRRGRIGSVDTVFCPALNPNFQALNPVSGPGFIFLIIQISEFGVHISFPFSPILIRVPNPYNPKSSGSFANEGYISCIILRIYFIIIYVFIIYDMYIYIIYIIVVLLYC